MDGCRWMVQVKREKTIPPSAVKTILQDVSVEEPPYGYMLIAAASFSKRCYDIFREELTSRGVMEFYLWGRAELEDLLYLPKNDRILFTFFGLSFVSRRRSRTTELRSAIAVKNKLFKLLGSPHEETMKSILIRDIDDSHYPYENMYSDFDKNPRWLERYAIGSHPHGLVIENACFNAVIDETRREYDFTEATNLIHESQQSEEKQARSRATQRRVLSFTDYLPRFKQGTITIRRLLSYESIVLVDPEGDVLYTKPHLYAIFSSREVPFAGERLVFAKEGRKGTIDKDWKRAEIFPKCFKSPRILCVRLDRSVGCDAVSLKNHLDFKNDLSTLYAEDGRLDDLSPGDVVSIGDARDTYLRVTFKSKVRFAEYISVQNKPYEARRYAKQQVGRELDNEVLVTIIETQRAHIYELEPERRRSHLSSEILP